MEHYHKRSNIETAYSMFKETFGSALLSKSDTGQINEVLWKVLCHNICVLVHTRTRDIETPFLVQNSRLNQRCPLERLLVQRSADP